MASSTTLNLTISSVDAPLFDGEVVSVTVPGTEGVMTILAHHEPIVSLLKDGTVHVKTTSGEVKDFEIQNGVIEVSNNHAMILL